MSARNSFAFEGVGVYWGDLWGVGEVWIYHNCPCRFKLASPGLQAGRRYVLKLSYRGLINEHLAGLYRSHYQQDGETK